MGPARRRRRRFLAEATASFEFGLARVLDGIQACIDRRADGDRPAPQAPGPAVAEDWPELASGKTCRITTAGRATGTAHTVSVWFAVDANTVYALPRSGLDADWVRNLVADPAVTIATARHTVRAPATSSSRRPNATTPAHA